MATAKRTALRAASIVLVAGVTTLSACASHMRVAPPPAVRASAMALGASELRDTSFANLYDLILARRPAWLISRAADLSAPASEVEVFYDLQRLTGATDLRTIGPSSLHSVSFVDPVANKRGRMGNQRETTAGMIVIRSKALMSRTE